MSGSGASAYINHHLIHWQWSPTGDISSFWTFNLDTILISILCGIVFLTLFRYAANRATVKNPSRLQLFVESVVLMVDDQATPIIGERDLTVSSLALTVFVWIWLMNFMDLIPVDLLPVIASHLGIPVFRAVPTADLSMTLAMSISVILIANYEGMKNQGIKHYLWGVLSQPFSIYCFPANIILRLIEDCTKPISLAMRLFGNMFSGELVFFLIALAPFYFQWLLAWVWLALHVFIITLQSFIFMILTVIYVGMARDPH